ncbi:MAG: hypothetical protein JSW50_13085 [Candidatus Latescibacterota bacterium]|nr:MAG: hypothetical protein JSW50_13085 [Candidatus Latescibacterota bacterium]
MRISFETDITHFGRIARGGDPGAGDRHVYSDSIRLLTQKPHRIDAFMSADTLFSRSDKTGTAVSSETMGPADSMLACLFRGPALKIGLKDAAPEPTVEHLKTECPAGIYQRLDLPNTYGMFVARTESSPREAGDHWVAIKEYPSLSGLGFSPHLRLSFRVKRVENGTMTVDVSCDTTISNVRTIMPSGETADIIAGRILIAGTLQIRSERIVHEGWFDVSEEVTYVRPALDTGVLSKTCTYRIGLEDF